MACLLARFLVLLAGQHRFCAAHRQPHRHALHIVREVATIPADEVMMTCVTMGYPDDGLPPMRCARAASTIRSLYPTSALPMSTTREIILCGIFFGAESSVASCNLEHAGGTICRLRGLLLARGN
ncbi:hypothetical protein SE91_16495 [Bradyrhizobium sp. DOA1]|nr:hypothetical protein SE91_16495 [Bradyrhizobium sp. DOA1]